MKTVRSSALAFGFMSQVMCLGVSQNAIPSVPEKNFSDVVEKASSSVAFISTEEGSGSGFYVDSEGHVVTARHVIKLRNGSTATKILIEVKSAAVMFGNGNVFQGNSSGVSATVLSEDAEHDIALLKPSSNPLALHIIVVNGKDLGPKRHPATICTKSTVLRSGEPIFTVGHPFGDYRRVTTAGIIASSEPFELDSTRQLRGTYLVNMLINHGNSGGPVFSREGCVIGVADAIRLAPIEAMAMQGSTQQSPMPGVDNRLAQVVPAYNSGLGILVPHQYVIDLLRKAGLTVHEGIRQP